MASAAPSSSAAWWRAPKSRLANGRLVTPNDESAKDAIQALREAGAPAELVTRLNNDLNQRLLAAARDAAAEGDQAGVQANLDRGARQRRVGCGHQRRAA